MLIGINDIEESLYHIKMKKKQMAMDRLIEICQEVIKIEVKAQKTFIENPKRYIIEESKIKTGLMHIKEHAKWASQTSTGAWYFKDKE